MATSAIADGAHGTTGTLAAILWEATTTDFARENSLVAVRAVTTSGVPTFLDTTRTATNIVDVECLSISE